ncbi:hypothetical protein MAR_002731, partial [Mya arenaria]
IAFLQIAKCGAASEAGLHNVEGSETQRPTLTATGISKDQTITLTCNIHEGTARSVGWYRNQGRKVISIGYVNDSCETSPPELPFSAKCLCLNITVYTCTLTVNGTFVASCNHRNRTAELSEPEFKELFGISITPRGWCIFTVFNLTGTQHRINISSTSALKEVFIEHKAYPECMGPSNLDFTLKVKGTQTPHAGESEGQETPDEERELTEQNPESNGEIHVGQNGGAQASHRGDTGPWARFVEYLRTCFHRNQ